MATKVSSKKIVKKKEKYLYTISMTKKEYNDYLYLLIKRKEEERAMLSLQKCRECGKVRKLGEKTKHCLDCLDWKYSDLQR